MRPLELWRSMSFARSRSLASLRLTDHSPETRLRRGAIASGAHNPLVPAYRPCKQGDNHEITAQFSSDRHALVGLRAARLRIDGLGSLGCERTCAGAHHRAVRRLRQGCGDDQGLELLRSGGDENGPEAVRLAQAR